MPSKGYSANFALKLVAMVTYIEIQIDGLCEEIPLVTKIPKIGPVGPQIIIGFQEIIKKIIKIKT